MKAADKPTIVYRLGRRPDPWAWPDWAFAEPDGTFGNRYDDPQSTYRVLYASTQRFATFVECLAYYRRDPQVSEELEEIVGEDEDQEPPSSGVVPREWIQARCIGTGALVGDYVNIGHHETLAELREALADRIVHYHLEDLDAATIRLTSPRTFTQEISRYVFKQTVSGTRRWNGIAYQSKHGDDLENWAIFEPASPDDTSFTDFDENDEDFHKALQLHRLELG